MTAPPPPRRVVRLEDLAPPPQDDLRPLPDKARRRPRDAAKQGALAAIQSARLDTYPPISWVDPRTGRRVLRLPYYL